MGLKTVIYKGNLSDGFEDPPHYGYVNSSLTQRTLHSAEGHTSYHIESSDRAKL